MIDEKQEPVSRPRGRPKEASEPLTSIVSICLTPSEHDEMIRRANSHRVSSLSRYGRSIVLSHLGRPDQLPTDK